MPVRRILALPVIAAMVALPACGDDDGDAATATTEATTTTLEERDSTDREVDEAVVERVAEAAENTVDEGTARFTIEATSEDTGFDDDSIEVEGEVDFDAGQRRLTFSGADGDLDMIVDGSEVYLELPATEDDDWVRVDLDLLFDTEVGTGGPGGIPFQDPTDNIRVLGASVVEASEEGTEQVNGEDTTHHRLVIDLVEAADESTDDARDAAERLAEQTGLEELEMEVWIGDDDDLIHRIAYVLDLDDVRVDETDDDAVEGSVEADPEGRLVVTVDYRDFGTDVDIELPSEDQIIDLDEEAIRDTLGDLDGGGSGRDDDTTTTTSDDDTTTTEDDDTTTTTSS
jgi:hypothetical protein